jgi:streptogramin lyase
VPAPPLSKTGSASASGNGLARQPTRLTRKRLGILLGLIFVGGIVAAALDLRFVIGGSPRRVRPNSILVLDARTMESLANRKGGFAAPSVVRRGGLVWAVDGDRNLVIATNPYSKRVFRKEVVGTDPVAVAVGFGAAWVANAGNGSITRVPLVGAKVETLGLNDQPSAIATGAGHVWVASRRGGKVIRIDPKTKLVDKTVRLANPPLAVRVVAPGRVQVAIGD